MIYIGFIGLFNLPSHSKRMVETGAFNMFQPSPGQESAPKDVCSEAKAGKKFSRKAQK